MNVVTNKYHIVFVYAYVERQGIRSNGWISDYLCRGHYRTPPGFCTFEPATIHARLFWCSVLLQLIVL